jgi:hypothetical protein
MVRDPTSSTENENYTTCINLSHMFLYEQPEDYPLMIKIHSSTVKMKDTCLSNRSSCVGLCALTRN